MKSSGMVLIGLVTAAGVHAQTMVYSNDFEAAQGASLDPGGALLEAVQDFAGLGSAGNRFDGSFLRSATGNVVTLTLTNLPTHSRLNLGLLFAAIDSLDGTGSFPSGDYFHITLDGQTLFRESFANALPSQVQSYVPTAGVELARHIDLGFGGPGGYYTDSAYNLGADSQFQNLAHSAATASFTFQIEGVGNQSLSDESWAMDQLRVSVNAVPEPQTYALMVAGLGLLGAVVRRRATAGSPADRPK